MKKKPPARRQVHWPDWKRIRLSPWQWRFLADKSPRKIANVGRGGGKTFIVLLDALIRAHELFAKRRQLGYWPRLGPMVVVGIVAPNLNNLRDMWGLAKALCPKTRGQTSQGEPLYLARENAKTINLYGKTSGIEIRIISAWLPNSLRGSGFDILVADEWAFAGQSKDPKKKLMEKSGDEVWSSILQKLVNRSFYLGDVIFASTPFANWWDDWCQQAMTGEGEFGKWSYHHATALDNVFLTPAQRQEIADEELTNVYKYRQERLAELHVVVPRHAATDYAFGRDLLTRVELPALPMPSVGPYAVAIDMAWRGTDHLCVLVFDLPLRCLVHCQLHPSTGLQDVLRIFHMERDRWRPAPGKLAFDSTGEGGKVEGMLPAHWEAQPVRFTTLSKPSLVKAVELRMQQGHFFWPGPEFDYKTLPHFAAVPDQDQEANFRQLRLEFVDYRKQEDQMPMGDKRVRYFKGPNADRDDTCDASSVLGHVLPPIQVRAANEPTKEQKLARLRTGLAGAFS